jgi:Flp pilus assembly protein TadD
MAHPEAEKFCEEGIKAVNHGNTLVALLQFEKAAQLAPTPVICSYLAYCLAKERGTLKKAIVLCNEAIFAEPRNTVHYLNLGRIYLLAKKKKQAIDTFRKGLKLGKNQQIVKELNGLGLRKEPVFSFLSRDNFLNKICGIIYKKFGLR